MEFFSQFAALIWELLQTPWPAKLLALVVVYALLGWFAVITTMFVVAPALPVKWAA